MIKSNKMQKKLEEFPISVAVKSASVLKGTKMCGSIYNQDNTGMSE